MTLEEKTRYFQELMQELKQREEELAQLNLEIASQRGKQATKPPDSHES